VRRLIARRALLRRGAAFGLLGPALGRLPAVQAAAPASPPRLVSVGGALTEMVYALDAQSLLVGVDTTSLFPAAARSLPSVGYARTLSAEGVLSLAPTRVMASEDAGPPAVLRQIVAAGVPVTVLPANHRFEGMLERLRRIGELTARQPQADALAQRLREDWAAAQAQVATHVAQRRGKPLRVLFVLSHAISQVMVAGTDTSAQAMLEYAGAVNALAGFTGFKPLTVEAVIAAQPDVILATDQGLQAAGGAAAIARLPGLADTAAGRAQRVASLEAMLLLGFGPRLPQAVRSLDNALLAVAPA